MEHVTICPYCGTENNMASNVLRESGTPRDGDISMCFCCGGFAIFQAAAAGGLREPEDHELRQLNADPGVKAMVMKWRSVKGNAL